MSDPGDEAQSAPIEPPQPTPASPDPDIWMTDENIRGSKPPPEEEVSRHFTVRPDHVQKSER